MRYSEIALEQEEQDLREHKHREAVKRAQARRIAKANAYKTPPSDCGRVPVKAKDLCERMFNGEELHAWIFNADRAKWGMDPWTYINGIDKATEGETIFLEYGNSSEKKVGPDYIVWVQK